MFSMRVTGVKLYRTFRLIVLVSVVLLSIGVIAIAAEHSTRTRSGTTAAVFTILAVLALVVLDYGFKWAPVTYTVVDITVIGFLCILWLASSIDATVKIHHFVSVSKDGVDHHCDDFVVGAPVDPWCTGQNGALASLSWIALSMLVAYLLVYLRAAARARRRGNLKVWYTSVNHAPWNSTTPVPDQIPLRGRPRQTSDLSPAAPPPYEGDTVPHVQPPPKVYQGPQQEV